MKRQRWGKTSLPIPPFKACHNLLRPFSATACAAPLSPFLTPPFLHHRNPRRSQIFSELCRSAMERSQSLEKIRQITKKLQKLGSLKNALSFKLRRRSFDQEEEEEEKQTERRRSESSVPRALMADYAVKEDLQRTRRSESSVPRGYLADCDRQRKRRPENSVPRGHLAIYAAKEDCEGRRFVIPVDYLKQPVFKDLLRMAEEEFGFDYVTGILTIPCDPEHFEEIINRLKFSGGILVKSSSSGCAFNSKSYFSNNKALMVR